MSKIFVAKKYNKGLTMEERVVFNFNEIFKLYRNGKKIYGLCRHKAV
ncbi:hypothetical protein BN3087_150009 [Sulfurovum sp. enrichment culture clone C5]|uniref:Uncharacterized protein n=1 Tax=Sulfurovum sp. enrichment culture clone C5 TaxID=497650 RepID=A0A0S4XKW6_9BACT|nr:hypothetical protein BN3087_150009 [Sulfurovum sp. enrichment culture clone C5]